MRILGLIGGTSWHSTVRYYSLLNQAVNDHFGDNTNPSLLLFNLNHAEVHALQKADDWTGITEIYVDAGKKLKAGGAEALIFCANTAHKVASQASEQVGLPLIHIADATADEILRQEVSAVAFIGTKFSMKEDFITSRLKEHGLEVYVPQDEATLDEIHRIIHQELSFGDVKPSSKNFMKSVVQSLLDRGARGLILGCTEFSVMFTQDDFDVPIFDTTSLHARAGVSFALSR